MKTYIYIKNDGIQFVTVDGKDTSYSQLEINQGAILNGVIMNAKALKDVINTVVPKPKKVELIIDSSNIMTKKVITPLIKQDKINEIVKGEFDLFDKEELYQFDSTIIKEDVALSIMGYAVSRDLIESYTNLFTDCGIKVSRIDIVTNGIINYIRNQSEFANKTFVFNIIVGESMLSLFFENGEYKLTNRIRLLQKNQGDVFYQELYTRLSSMVQFSHSERSQSTIEQSFYVGLSDVELKEYAAYVSELTQVNIQGYSDSEIDLEYFYPSLLKYAKKKDINFAVNKDSVTLKQIKRKNQLIQAGIAGGVVVLLSAYTISLFMNYYGIKKENESLSAYISSKEVTEGLEEFSQLQEENLAVSSVKDTIEQVLEKNAISNPSTEEVLLQVFGSENIESFSYDYSNGAVSITATAASSQDAVDYATALRGEGFFVSMEYKGYSFNDEDGEYYTFNISANFKTEVEETDETAGEVVVEEVETNE